MKERPDERCPYCGSSFGKMRICHERFVYISSWNEEDWTGEFDGTIYEGATRCASCRRIVEPRRRP